MARPGGARFSEALFPEALVNRIPDEDGISYGMLIGPGIIGTPGGAYLERQSTRQPLIKHRSQWSGYISKFMLGLQAEINYPIARASRIVNSAPDNIGQAPNGRQGTMRQPSRFKKALPLPLVPFNPPVY